MSEYIQRGELFSFDLLKCLRTDYFHNDCRECLEICPKDAFFFDRKRLSVDFEKCTNCSVCLGVCPTEALSLEFFDPNDYVVRQSGDEVLLSCKKDIPCLSAFDSEHFAALLLRKEKVACDLSHCEGCELNPENRTLKSIQERIDEAQRFVAALGIEKEIGQRGFEESRRGFFKAIFSVAKEVGRDERFSDLQSAINRLPVKMTLLKNSIKTDTNLPNKRVSTHFSFLASKSIDESCTNCGDCVQFCPTDALFFAKDGTAIWFISGKCIDCAICNDICKPRSICDKDEIDIVAWAFDRGEELIAHTLEICQECKTPFPYRGGELICDRCKSFVKDFGDIFRLASEDSE